MNRIAKGMALTLMLLSLIMSPIAHAETIEPFASNIISSYTISMSRGDGGVVTAATSIIAKPLNGCDKLGFTYLRIQEYRDGSWVTVKTALNKYNTNAKQHSYSMSYNGTVGMQYRSTVSFFAELDGETETRTATSVTVTARN